MDQDPFQEFMAPHEGQYPAEGTFNFPPSDEYKRQLDLLPTNSHTFDSYNMFSDPINQMTDYELNFPFGNAAEEFPQLDPSFLLSNTLNSESSKLHQTNFQNLFQSFHDNEGEININTSSYITPDEIDRFEKAFPMPGVKSELKQLLRAEDLLGGNRAISEDSDVEEGEIVDEATKCPAPQTAKHLVAKCAQGPNEPMPLPQGWVQAWHKCGMPVYLHTETRVVTLSRPYFLPYIRSLRTHFIPVDSVPCMKEWMLGKKEGATVLEQKCGLKNAKEFPTLSHDKVQVYLRELWEFEEREVESYKGDDSVRKRNENPNMVEIGIPKEFKETHKNKGVWRINMTNKTPVALIDEYARFFLRSRAEYSFREVTDFKNPFICTVSLKGSNYASENGTSKKLAKQKACESTLKLVCPELYQKFQEFQNKKTNNFGKHWNELYEMNIDDASAMEKLNEAGLPRPFQILKQCIQMKSVIAKKPEFVVEEKENQTFRISLEIGKFSASVDCTNKRDGKNTVSQRILKQMYPNLSLGALIDLHTNIALSKDKTDMPTNSQYRDMTIGMQEQPKTKILEILRTEMLKLNDRMQQGKPISDKYAKLEATVRAGNLWS